jgi:hypothetical protein
MLRVIVVLHGARVSPGSSFCVVRTQQEVEDVVERYFDRKGLFVVEDVTGPLYMRVVIGMNLAFLAWQEVGYSQQGYLD